MKNLFSFFSNVKNLYDGVLTLQSLVSRVVYLLGELLSKVESYKVEN